MFISAVKIIRNALGTMSYSENMINTKTNHGCENLYFIYILFSFQFVKHSQKYEDNTFFIFMSLSQKFYHVIWRSCLQQRPE